MIDPAEAAFLARFAHLLKYMMSLAGKVEVDLALGIMEDGNPIIQVEFNKSGDQWVIPLEDARMMTNRFRTVDDSGRGDGLRAFGLQIEEAIDYYDTHYAGKPSGKVN